MVESRGSFSILEMLHLVYKCSLYIQQDKTQVASDEGLLKPHAIFLHSYIQNVQIIEVPLTQFLNSGDI